jgi:hypothetical protein
VVVSNADNSLHNSLLCFINAFAPTYGPLPPERTVAFLAFHNSLGQGSPREHYDALRFINHPAGEQGREFLLGEARAWIARRAAAPNAVPD